MKKWFFPLSLLIGACLLAVGCLKDNSNNVPGVSCATVTTAAPNNEISTLKQRLDSSGVYSVIQDPRGFFYRMDSTAASDSGTHATVCSSAAVTYSLSLVGDTSVIEKSDSVIGISLYTTITGWQEAVPLMRKNATMILYLPPTLAYGAAGSSKLPPNAYISFVIKLYDFAN